MALEGGQPIHHDDEAVFSFDCVVFLWIHGWVLMSRSAIRFDGSLTKSCCMPTKRERGSERERERENTSARHTTYPEPNTVSQHHYSTHPCDEVLCVLAHKLRHTYTHTKYHQSQPSITSTPSIAGVPREKLTDGNCRSTREMRR